jgi:hypothetical protein
MAHDIVLRSLFVSKNVQGFLSSYPKSLDRTEPDLVTGCLHSYCKMTSEVSCIAVSKYLHKMAMISRVSLVLRDVVRKLLSQNYDLKLCSFKYYLSIRILK